MILVKTKNKRPNSTHGYFLHLWMDQSEGTASMTASFLSLRHFKGLCCGSSGSVAANIFDLICPLCRKLQPAKKNSAAQQPSGCSKLPVILSLSLFFSLSLICASLPIHIPDQEKGYPFSDTYVTLQITWISDTFEL